MSSPPAPAHQGIAVTKEMFSRPLNGEIEHIFFACALFPYSYLDLDLDLWSVSYPLLPALRLAIMIDYDEILEGGSRA